MRSRSLELPRDYLPQRPQRCVCGRTLLFLMEHGGTYALYLAQIGTNHGTSPRTALLDYLSTQRSYAANELRGFIF